MRPSRARPARVRARLWPAVLAALFLPAGSGPLAPADATAQDVREAVRRAEQDRADAEARARQVEQQVLQDRARLQAEVERLETRQAELQRELVGLQAAVARDTEKAEGLRGEWTAADLEFRELSGNVRVVARDLEAVLLQSPLTAMLPERLERVRPLLAEGYFPDLEDIGGMADVFLEEARLGGQIGLRTAPYIGRDGQDSAGRVLTLGKFTAIYDDGEELGFLTYAPESQTFYALPSLPPRSLRGQMGRYLAGQSALVPIDLSGGTALRQVSRQISVQEHLRSGGPIVIPILALAVVALFIVVSKTIFLQRVHGRIDRVTDEVNALAARGEWAACEEAVGRQRDRRWPIIHVIAAGLSARHADRETIESTLQEAILHELPRVERGLALLAVIGAIAPLLGLLGTVTGMIDTFRVITLYGTGDPKLMSGGISEALITTEVGLMVAIPIMLAHVLLNRRVEHVVGEMEERAVQLTNLIMRERVADDRRAVANA